jgi:drug/metabolite transporter (DMT)-like permease
LLSIIYGLLSALTWGAGDFTGGLAARRTGALRAVFYGEIIGLAAVIALSFLDNEPVPPAMVWGLTILAGALGTMGLLLLYHSMTTGLMSIATPVSALLAAVLPVIVGAATEGFPSAWTFVGFAFALAAVWMISQGRDGVTDILSHIADLKLPLLAGVGFGLYFVLMNIATQETSLFWPMVGSRSGGMLILTFFMILRREPLGVTRGAWGVIFLNGLLDIFGNGFYILAGQTGRMDVSAVLGALYPGGTVLLAWIFLHERLSRNQWIGIAFTLISIILMTI